MVRRYTFLYFEYNTRLSVAKKLLQYCCYHKVKWDYLNKRKNNQIKQCHNCQNFGHHKTGCGRVHRCVKCTDQHSPGKCQKIKEKDDPACCNCGGKHPANYKGCIKAQQYIKNARNSSTSSQKPKKTPTIVKQRNGTASQKPHTKLQGSNVRRTLTFSSAVKGKDEAKQDSNWKGVSNLKPHSRGSQKVSENINTGFGNANTDQGFSFIANETQSLFGVSFFELMGAVNAFLPLYRQRQDPEEKKLLLLEFIFRVSV